MQKYDIGALPHTNTKINSKWIKDLNVRAKTIVSQKKTVANLCDLRLGNGVIDMTPKAQATKEKINWTSSKF